jgi:pimeloyl-ACP methyl ester carboxylesterase
MRPKTQYASHPEGRIAYQVVGQGPVDLLVVPGFISHLDLTWAMPTVAAMYRRLASFSRLILFDKLGTGISDPIAHVPTLEERMDEVLAVLDAAGSERAGVLSLSEGGLMSILFAATHPRRTLALALYGAFPCGSYDEALPAELREPVDALTAEMFAVVEHWGDGRISGERRSWNLGFFERAAANQAMARGMVEAGRELDVRGALGAVRVPTAVIHRSGDPFPIGAARWMAERIPGARFVELPGYMHPPWRGDMEAVADAVEGLLRDAASAPAPEHELATVLSADVAPSPFVSAQLERFGGRPVTGGGNGVLAAFDGPARAIRCAQAIVTAAPAELGATARAGLHTGDLGPGRGAGEPEAARLGAQVAQLAAPGEVLVSHEVKSLVVGSGLAFTDRGEHRVEGVPGPLHVHGVVPGGGEPPRDPELARRPVDSLTHGERMRLGVARHAPGFGRLASRTLQRLRGVLAALRSR